MTDSDVLERLEAELKERAGGIEALKRLMGPTSDWRGWIRELGTTRDAISEIKTLRAEVARLRTSPWVTVQRLTPEGPVEVDDPQYPEPGQVVLIEVTSRLGTKYEVGGLHPNAGKVQGYWSWPSFGLRWTPIPPIDPTPEQV